MQCDIFFSICQASIEGVMPSEAQMLTHFLEQVRLADHLGFKTAWVAESHFSSQVQQQHLNPVIPKFKGEVGLNTDILQLAHHIFGQTDQIAVGSAIKNIICHGGPLTHAEAVKTFLWLKSTSSYVNRELKLGIAGGRFEYMTRPFGIRPRTPFEASAWPMVKGKLVKEAVEIFLKALRGDTFSSTDITPNIITKSDCRTPQLWETLTKDYHNLLVTQEQAPYFKLQPFWEFEPLKIVPHDPSLQTLSLYLGSHDPNTQIHANKTLPCRVFNLSITSPQVIEDTHERMKHVFQTEHKQVWQRSYLPRTVLVFLDATPLVSESTRNERAKARAEKVLGQYWQAMSGTIDPKRLSHEVEHALYGSPSQVAKQIRSRYHEEDCLMLWFDFYCHDNHAVKESMKTFAKDVMPLL